MPRSTADIERAFRAELADRVYSKLVADIGEFTPRGFGYSDDAWGTIDGPTDEFTNAVNEWEATGSETALNRWLDLYPKVLDGWRKAAAAYRTQHPTKRSA